MSNALYEISEQYKALLELSDEIPEDAFRDTLEAIEGEFDLKADNIACVIKDLEGYAQSVKDEIERLEKKRTSAFRRIENLKNYLFEQMQAVGKIKILSPRNTITIKKKPVSVKLSPDFIEWAQSHTRDDLLRYKLPEADKSAIKMALENGEVIPAELVTGERLDLK